MLKTLSLVKIFLTQLFSIRNNKKKVRLFILFGVIIVVYGSMFVGMFYSIIESFKSSGSENLNQVLYFPISIISLVSAFFMFLSGNQLSLSDKDIAILGPLPIDEKKIVRAKLYVCLIFESAFQLLIGGAGIISLIVAKEANFINLFSLITVTCLASFLPIIILSVIVLFVRKLIFASKHRSIIQFIISLLASLGIILLSFQSNGFIGNIIENPENLISKFESIMTYFPLLFLIKLSLDTSNILWAILYIVLVLLIFYIFVLIFSKYAYKLMINYKYTREEKYKGPKEYKKSSVMSFLLKSEFKRFRSSQIFATNILISPIIGILLGAYIAIGNPFASIEGMGDNFGDIIFGIILIFTSCMCYSPAITLSMDWKYIWQLRSLPIDEKNIFMSKIIFNLILQIPSGLISLIIYSIFKGLSIYFILSYILLVISISIFLSLYYLLIGLKNPKLGVEDIYIVKQSAAANISILTSFAFLNVFFGIMIAGSFVFKSIPYIGILVVIVINIILSIVMYSIIKKKGRIYYQSFM